MTITPDGHAYWLVQVGQLFTYAARDYKGLPKEKVDGRFKMEVPTMYSLAKGLNISTHLKPDNVLPSLEAMA